VCLAFCPSVSELSFLSFVSLCFPSGGCSLVGKVVVFDLEADLFLTVLSFLVFGPRGTSFCFPYCGCSHVSEVGVVDPEANLFFVSLVVGALLK